MGKREPSPHAAAAAAIRKELKAFYPAVAFSVRSSSFSGGDAVDLTWTDGPTIAAIEAIVKKYQYGHFDGSIDLYEYSNRRDDIPQTKFVQVRRDWSRHAFAALVDLVNRRYGYALVVDARYGGTSVTTESDKHTGHGWQSQELWRLFSPLSLLCPACAAATLPGDRFCPACGASCEPADEAAPVAA